MNTDICIGIHSKDEILEIATIESGSAAKTMIFPATGIGFEAIRGFFSACDKPVRLAVAGAAALSVALMLSRGMQSEVFIVAPSIADHAVALAKYAERAI